MKSSKYKRFTHDVEYFNRKDYLERLKKIGSQFSSHPSLNNSFALIVNPMILSQHVFSYFEAYSPDWTRFILVCKDWFDCIVMEEDGLLWRELFRTMLNGMTKYALLSPFNSLNYKLESFDTVSVHEERRDERFKELPDRSWKENYDDILIHSLGLKKGNTEFDTKTTRYIARCFLDENVKLRNRGDLATVRELFLHKFLFDAIFPMTLQKSHSNAYVENPLLRNDSKILEKKLYFVETSGVVDTLLNLKEIKNGIMLRISYLSAEDGLVHYQFYGMRDKGSRILKYLIDVEENTLTPDLYPTQIHKNLLQHEEFDSIQLATGMESFSEVELSYYLTSLQELLCKKFGNLHLVELFSKYWYCINRVEDPLSVSFSDQNPFWFLDILAKKAQTSIEKKFLAGLSVSCISVLRLCKAAHCDWVTFDSFGSRLCQYYESEKKNKKLTLEPEEKELIQVNSKLDSTFNLSVPECWNWRGLLIRNLGNGKCVVQGLMTSREGILVSELDIYNKEKGELFIFDQLKFW